MPEPSTMATAGRREPSRVPVAPEASAIMR